MKQPRVTGSVGSVMDINITDYFFKVCFKTSRTQDVYIPETGASMSHVVPLDPAEEYSLALWLPTYVIDGHTWTAVGYIGDDDDDLIGFDERSPVIRELPMIPGVVYDGTYKEVFQVKLITTRHNFELVFMPYAISLNVVAEQVYYYVQLRETALGRAMSCKFNVCTQRGESTIDIDQDFSDFFGEMLDLSSVLVTTPLILDVGDRAPDCAICLGEMSGNCSAMRCLHTFCEECILEWLRTRFTCPICRALA